MMAFVPTPSSAFNSVCIPRSNAHSHRSYLEKEEWSEVKVKKGESPSPRHSHTAVVWKNSLFIFGGALEKGALDNTLYSFNFGTIYLCRTLTHGARGFRFLTCDFDSQFNGHGRKWV